MDNDGLGVVIFKDKRNDNDTDTKTPADNSIAKNMDEENGKHVEVDWGENHLVSIVNSDSFILERVKVNSLGVDKETFVFFLEN